MEIKKAIVVLNAELQHTKQHIQYENKAKEYYEEMQDIIDATEMAIAALEKQELLEAANAHLKSMQKILIETQNISLPTLDISLSTLGEMRNNSLNQKIDRSE